MKPRGKRNKAVHNKNSKKKFTKNKTSKARKTYSLYQKPDGSSQKFNKRKKSFNSDNVIKRQKIENKVTKAEETSSEEELEEDNMQMLLSTFNSNVLNKKTIAIDSSEDSMSEDIDHNNTEEEDTEEEENDTEEEEDELQVYEDINVLNENINKESNVNQNQGEGDINNLQEIKEEDELDIETQKEDEDTLAELQDPFAKHLFYDLSDVLLNCIQQNPIIYSTHTQEWSLLGNLFIQLPKCEDNIKETSKGFGISEAKRYAVCGSKPERILNKSNLESLYIKTQIVDNLVKANSVILDCNSKFPLTAFQTEMFSVINNYQDFYFTQRTFDNAEEIRFVYCLHIVNHILKTRTKVLHHNARLNKKDDVPEEFRDQGLVRPKVCI